MRKILHFIKKFPDVLYPKRCALCDELLKKEEPFICIKCSETLKFINDRTCVKCGAVLKSRFESFCSECLNSRRLFDEGFAPFVYDGIIRDSIVRYKYHFRAEYAPFYAACIYKYGKDRIKNWRPEVIIPVPAHLKRVNKRGYDQAFLLADELGRLINIPVSKNLIKRTKITKAQKELSAAERRKNLFEAFEYISVRSAPERVLIVDDIFTTGSTVNALSYILRSHGTKYIYVVCIGIS